MVLLFLLAWPSVSNAQPSGFGPLDQLQAAQAAAPWDRARAERIARLLVRQAAPGRPREAAALGAVFDADRRFGVDLQEALAAPAIRPSWRYRRWMRDALTARDPDVRALMRRTFADQLRPDLSVAPALQPAFDVLIAQRRARLSRVNARWLTRVLARIGWFCASRYGAEAAQAASLLVGHAGVDPGRRRLGGARPCA